MRRGFAMTLGVLSLAMFMLLVFNATFSPSPDHLLIERPFASILGNIATVFGITCFAYRIAESLRWSKKKLVALVTTTVRPVVQEEVDNAVGRALRIGASGLVPHVDMPSQRIPGQPSFSSSNGNVVKFASKVD